MVKIIFPVEPSSVVEGCLILHDSSKIRKSPRCPFTERSTGSQLRFIWFLFLIRMLGNRFERGIKIRREREENVRKLEAKVRENEALALQVKFLESASVSAMVADRLQSLVCVPLLHRCKFGNFRKMRGK